MSNRKAIIARMMIILGLILLIPVSIAVQIVRIQVFEGDGLRVLWSSQALDEIPITAERGRIFDRNGTLLATNRVETQLVLDPLAPGMNTELVDSTVRVLSRHTGTSADSYREKIRRNTASPRYILLEKSLDMDAVDAMKRLGFNGIILSETYRRKYSFESLGSHVLGFVNHQGDGMTGLEASYDEVLKGEDGAQQVRRDRSNRIYAYVGAPRRQPEHGADLHTTLDATIQAIVEEELEEGVKRYSAKRGIAIVMEPETGAIRAMANYPWFNPNDPAASKTEHRRNYAIADMIEPGSTFKLVTAVASVEQGVVRMDEMFDTPEDGKVVIHGQVMRDHEPLGRMSLPQVFARSSNVATSEIAMRLQPSVFYQYARNMGYGSPTNIDLPNEMPGRLQKPFEWSQVTLPWMSIGYEVQTTPLQMLQSYAAFANHGVLMRPYVVERITGPKGEIVRQHPENGVIVREVAEESTLKTLLPMFMEVLTDSGTAGMAAIPGLSIAGKTGTAQKFKDGRYQTNYYASFAGFFPVEQPRYAILILIDEPKTIVYGGWTAGVTFREITKRIAGYDPEVKRAMDQPDTGWWADRDESSGKQEDAVERNVRSHRTAPKFTGLSREEAETLASTLGIKLNGLNDAQGWITAQDPAPGMLLQRSSAVNVTLEDFSASASTEQGFVLVPELRGMNMRQATHLLTTLGLQSERVGSGTIHAQFPRPGERLRPGRTVTVRGKARDLQTLAAGGAR